MFFMKMFDFIRNFTSSLKVKVYFMFKKIPASQIQNLVVKGDISLKMSSTSKVSFGKSVILSDCSIIMRENSELYIGDGASISGASISIGENSLLKLDSGVLMEKVNYFPLSFNIAKGSVEVGEGSRLRCSVSVQHGGTLKIGQKTFINEGSEIRCDRSVSIGSCTMISYQVDILDTNTHSTNWKERHDSIMHGYPKSLEREPLPTSKPVFIGDDCWIGKKAAVLKGVTIGDRSSVALGAIVTKSIPEDSLAYGNPALSKSLSP